MSNTIDGSPGRLGNQIIRSLATSFLAKKANLKFNYGKLYYPTMKELGLDLFIGTNTYSNTTVINDSNFETIFFQTMEKKEPVLSNIDIGGSYCQKKGFSNYLYNHFKVPENQTTILKANKYTERYKNNNDMFIHVRLTDVAHYSHEYEYFEKAVSSLTFENGYIASDDLNHEICQKLIRQFNLKPVQSSEVDTIMFGSTCKYVVLSSGSFTYMIGLLAFFSEVYYLKQKNQWCPHDIFQIDDWHEVNL